MASSSGPITAIGIDVGGARKGFHAVALRDGAWLDQLNSPDPLAIARWCRDRMEARVIGIDAPCRWSADGRMRPCERQLLAQGIRCFASPTRQQALAHPSNYFGWMLQGEALYRALESDYPLAGGLPLRGRVCFETFPHAITWQLRGGDASAALKQPQRSELLRQAGLAVETLTSIDWIDAALCALAAHRLAAGRPGVSYGEAGSGLILMPAGPAGKAGPD